MIPTVSGEVLEPVDALDVLRLTLDDKAALPPGTQSPSPAAIPLRIKELDDKTLLDYRVAVAEQIEDLRCIEHGIDLEVERRLRERNARAIAHPSFEKVELEEQYTPYAFDRDALREAAEILKTLGKDDEAAKLIRFVPEQTTIVPAHYEPGKAISVLALRDKYGDTPGIGDSLRRAITRTALGTRLSIKRKAVR